MQMGNKTAWRLTLAGAALLAGTAFLVLGGHTRLGLAASRKDSSTETTPKQTEPVAVTVASLTPRTVRRTVQIVGTLQGYEEVTITPKVEGRILKIHHDVGDIVKPGDLLLEIEDVDYRLAVNEAQKAVELELAKLGLKKLPTEELKDLDYLPTVRRAQTLEQNARQILDRARRLGRVLATEEVEKAQAERMVASATREQAIMEAKVALAAAWHRHAQLEIARQKLIETRVLAPVPSPRSLPRTRAASTDDSSPPGVEWVVSQRLVSEGEMVRAFPSMAAFKLVIDRSLKLMANVPERHMGDIKVGLSVGLSVEAYPGETFSGVVARVNPTVDRASRTFQIEVAVPNDDRRLRPGSFAKAAVSIGVDPNAATVPEEALVTFAGVTKVFVVRDDKAHAVPVRPRERIQVRTADRTENWVEVHGKLPPACRVVTSGHSQLAEGTPVRIRNSLTTSAQAAR